ncbi:MAG: DUF924 domain-containing protein [Albidovulum sp.]|nr:DUF924 domain-containing protein [Albidovulum sp.]
MKKYAPEEVLTFWTDEVGQDAWYFGGDEVDAMIRGRFEPLWNALMAGDYSDWENSPSGSLARIIVLDQFPRNIFRGSSKSFASDRLALGFAGEAINAGLDMKIPVPERQFFYMPYVHSEDLSVQDEGVRLMKEKMKNRENLLHARVHREIIARFGRFPYRNEALGRETTAEEAGWMEQGGYKSVVAELGG